MEQVKSTIGLKYPVCYKILFQGSPHAFELRRLYIKSQMLHTAVCCKAVETGVYTTLEGSSNRLWLDICGGYRLMLCIF